jgi:hypothetical protein
VDGVALASLFGHLALTLRVLIGDPVPEPPPELQPPRAKAPPAADLLQSAIRLPCQAKTIRDLMARAERLRPVRLESNWVHYSPNWGPVPAITGRRLVFSVGDDELTIKFAGAIGRPDHVAARYLAGSAKRPLLFALADGSCAIHTARRMTYDAADRPEWLQDLDEALHPIGEPEPLNPPVPAGEDPPGIPVGLVDSGVNYLLPEIASRLARGPEGEMLGFDYWDLDRRPFDVAPLPDPFHPDHHGTRTASLLLEEAPIAKLVPYRYPRRDMTRMAALIEDAADQGVRVMNLSLASRDRDEWLPFRAAAAAHPEMLFVVAAGNFGADIDKAPHYPAAFALPNMVVVTAATAGGRLTQGVNWGRNAVDLMAPGEDVVALDFDGRWRPVSGSSYATARVSGLAACLLADHPAWSATELKAALLAAAEADQAHKTARGFISDAALGTHGTCAESERSAQARTR